MMKEDRRCPGCRSRLDRRRQEGRVFFVCLRCERIYYPLPAESKGDKPGKKGKQKHSGWISMTQGGRPGSGKKP
jgi:DNA-directed RNA polymerase subunit RPC12/RpoP